MASFFRSPARLASRRLRRLSRLPDGNEPQGKSSTSLARNPNRPIDQPTGRCLPSSKNSMNCVLISPAAH
ncbi:MAG: hypothetical protein DLM68_11280 [Hyphomicrobiales bacterium]|nr:MAG: hypothetical protein DLM68_11280 [Hyphomicrobiales bacterium]